MTRCWRSVAVAVLVLAVAACSGVSRSAAPHASSREPSAPATSTTAGPTATVPAPVNGRITSVQRRLHTDAGSYHWLAFDRASDTGLFVTYGFCGACRPRTIDVAHLTVVGPAGRLATVACSTGPLCRARRLGTAATLGPGPDELTVESGSRTLVVIGYDGSLRRNLDLTATIARGQDVSWLAWSPDGSRLAVVAGRRLDGADVWLLEGDELLTLAYSGSNPWLMRPAWSPDGQRLMVDRMVPTRSGRSFRSSGADVVVFAGTSAGWSPPMTPRVLYRSNRGFDNAGNLAWSPDGTRIAVRVRDGVVEISAEDGRVLARHPQSRRTSGWLIWPRKDP